jgi:hypothetical protein
MGYVPLYFVGDLDNRHGPSRRNRCPLSSTPCLFRHGRRDHRLSLTRPMRCAAIPFAQAVSSRHRCTHTQLQTFQYPSCKLNDREHCSMKGGESSGWKENLCVAEEWYKRDIRGNVHKQSQQRALAFRYRATNVRHPSMDFWRQSVLHRAVI